MFELGFWIVYAAACAALVLRTSGELADLPDDSRGDSDALWGQPDREGRR